MFKHGRGFFRTLFPEVGNGGRILVAILSLLGIISWRGITPFSAQGQEVRPEQEVVSADALRRRLPDGILRWGGDAEGGAPYQLRDPDDPQRVIGFEVELADALTESIARRWGIELRAEFVQYEWVSLPLGLGKKDFDLIISGYEVSSESEEAILFSRPYYIYAHQLVVRRDREGIERVEDCVGYAVGTLSGSSAERILEQTPGVEIVAFDGQVEPYLDLELGRLEGVLLDLPIAVYYAEDNPQLKFTGLPFAQGEYSAALRPEDRMLASAVNMALGELFENGRWEQILKKWHLWNLDQAGLAKGDSQKAELSGLGFTEQGTPLKIDSAAPADAVEKKILAAAAQKWTFWDYAPLLLRASWMTISLTIRGMALAMVIGLLVAVSRLYGPWPLRAAALSYVEFFRGIPTLLLLFFLYYGLTGFGVQMSAEWTAVIGFGINYAAYEAEIYRGSIEAVPRRQWEAARALGMSDVTAFRRIIFPQAMRTALGPMTNDFVALFKDTSLVSVIAVRELTKEYLILSRSSLKFLELGLLTAALYLAMSIPLGYLSRYLEKRFSSGTRG